MKQVKTKLSFQVPEEVSCISHSTCEVRLQKAKIFALEHILKLVASQEFSENALVAFNAGTGERKDLENMLVCMGLPNLGTRIIESSLFEEESLTNQVFTKYGDSEGEDTRTGCQAQVQFFCGRSWPSEGWMHCHMQSFKNYTLEKIMHLSLIHI